MTGGQGAHGGGAQSGGNIVLRGGTIDVTGSLARGLWASGTGSTITSTDMAISTTGDTGQGALAESGGTIFLNGGSVTTTGSVATAAGAFGSGSTLVLGAGTGGDFTTLSTSEDFAHGIHASGGGSVSGGAVQIITGGTQAQGARAQSGGTVDLNGATISTAGDFGHGLHALDAGSSIILSSGTVETSGIDAFGVRAENSATLSINDALVITSGDGSYALNATGAGSQLFADNLTVSTTGVVDNIINPGTTASAVVAEAGATLNITLSSLQTTGDFSMGLLSQARGFPTNAPTMLIANQVSISTVGDGAVGAQACALAGAVDNCTDAVGVVDTAAPAPPVGLDISESAVLTTGAGAYGVYAFGQGAVISADTVTLSTTGTDAHGLVVRNGGIINAGGLSINTTGAGAATIYALGGSLAAPNIADLRNSQISSELGDLVRAEGAVLDINLNNTSTYAGSGYVLQSLDDQFGNHSSVDLFAVDTTLTGDVFVATGGLADITLQNSQLTGAATNLTNIDVGSASQWAVTGSSTVSQAIVNSGVISLLPPVGNPLQPASYKVLSTANYVGNGGLVSLNSYLSADNSPSDLLVIDGGAATGASLLSVRNSGGPGAPTVADGIRVVDAINGATTAAGAFSLLGDY
ncbi:hypothetical protein LH464_24175, partial [Neorhizobium sp. T786]|uniref:hypothetical protein n=1 Tax=Pseudorhizobium xiangyangii TaxID=2883104 RepID=UPI001CFFA38E